MSQVRRGTPAGDAYLDLQRKARGSGRPTEELHRLYVLEGFLARLAASPVRDRFVLKGGVLLAAFGDRRPTRDVDLSGLGVDNDAETIRGLVHQVLIVTPSENDGLVFQADSLKAEVIREADEYPGIRVSVKVALATARLSFHVDASVGDPIYPGSVTVSVPRLLGGEPITLRGYPIHMVHAEKIVTAVQLGTANTRWRDFGDIWTLTRRHPVDGSHLQDAITAVARHRNAQLLRLAEVLDGYAGIGQPRWSAWRRKNANLSLPERFGDVLAVVFAFAEPALSGEVGGQTWDHNIGQWR